MERRAVERRAVERRVLGVGGGGAELLAMLPAERGQPEEIDADRRRDAPGGGPATSEGRGRSVESPWKAVEGADRRRDALGLLWNGGLWGKGAYSGSQKPKIRTRTDGHVPSCGERCGKGPLREGHGRREMAGDVREKGMEGGRWREMEGRRAWKEGDGGRWRGDRTCSWTAEAEKRVAARARKRSAPVGKGGH